MLGCEVKTLSILKFINTQRRYRIFYPLAAIMLMTIKIRSESNLNFYYSSSLGKYLRFRNEAKNVLYSNYPFKGVLNTQDYLIGKNAIFKFLIKLLVWPMKWLEQRSLGKFSKIAVISRQAKEAYVNTFGLKQIEILHCPVNTSELGLIPERGLHDKCAALLICRLYSEKKVEEVLNCISQVQDINLTVIGAGPLLEEYRERFPNVKFLGFVTEKEKMEEFKNSDFLINPTPQEWSLTTVEANCSGIAVVSAECDAISEINQCISNQKDRPNLLFGTNYVSLISAIEKLKNISKRERQCALEHFSPAHFIERIKEFIND